MFQQSDKIRDYVFPLSIVDKSDTNTWSFQKFLGSGFLIGNRGFALTASHVLPDTKGNISAMFVSNDNEWIGYEIMQYEKHPSEDVAIIKLKGESWKSFFRMSNTWEGSSAKYMMFGYPEDVVNEIDDGNKVIARPDLIYTEGYVRRRIREHEIPSLKGSNFFELSEVAGQGCSGSPIFKPGPNGWDVIGIYIGEKLNDRSTSVSYAVMEEAFRNWIPSILGITVLMESQHINIPV